MIYIEFTTDFCNVRTFNVCVGGEFTVKRHGVIPNKSNTRAFNCRIGDYEETCVQVYRISRGKKVVMFDHFSSDCIGKFNKLYFDDGFYGIFKTKKEARKAFAKEANKAISSLESEIRKKKTRVLKTLGKIDELEDCQNA